MFISNPSFAQMYTSPRVAEAWATTEGLVGSPDGTIRGYDALRDFFDYSMRVVPQHHLRLLHVMRGMGGTLA